MSDADLCSEILKENFSGMKYICLDGTSLRGCRMWSEERVGKDSFIQELDRRYSSTKNCRKIIEELEAAKTSPPRFVLFDSRNPAFCVLYSFSDVKFLLDIKGVEKTDLAQMTLDWNKFTGNPGGYLDRCVITAVP